MNIALVQFQKSLMYFNDEHYQPRKCATQTLISREPVFFLREQPIKRSYFAKNS